MSGTVPPKAPSPQIKEVSHMSICLDWGEYADRLKEVSMKGDGRILVEVRQKVHKSDWTAIYSGYARSCVSHNLDPETEYSFQMRFKNNHGWGSYSEVVSATTEKQPMTGEHIHRAIRLNDPFELEKVLRKGEANIEAQDNLGFTPLMVTAQKGQTNLLEMLLEWHADLDNTNDSGKTALMLAAFKGQVESLELLIAAGAQLDRGDRSNLTALHHAVDGEQAGAIKVLVKAGADVNSRDSALSWTSLLRCAGLRNNGNTLIARELIRLGTHIDAQDRDGQTPLHLAVLNGHQRLVELLLTEGARTDIQSKQGNTPVDLAESMENRNVRAAFEEYWSKQNLEVIPGTLRVKKPKEVTSADPI